MQHINAVNAGSRSVQIASVIEGLKNEEMMILMAENTERMGSPAATDAFPDTKKIDKVKIRKNT